MRSNISQTHHRSFEWNIQTDIDNDNVTKHNIENTSATAIPSHYVNTQIWLTDLFFNLGKYIFKFLVILGGFFLRKENSQDSRFKFFGLCFLCFLILKQDSNFKFGALFPFIIQTEEEEIVDKTNAKKVSMDLSGTNIYAPVAAKNLEEEKVISYIKKYAPIAVKDMETYNIPASIKMAQALIESRAGRSRLAVKNNNHFGMKCFSKKCKKNHCTNATDDHHKDFFRKFDDPASSWNEHSKLISQGRYKKLQSYEKDYKKWANGLKAAGYATDKKYASKLINIIEKYQLQQLDQLTS